MSDDRFKEARRSLIDEEEDSEPEAADEEGGETIAEEKTQMVNLDELQKGAAQERQRNDQRRGGSPSHDGSARADSSRQKLSVPGDDEGYSDEKTAFVNLNDFADKEPEQPRSNSTTFTPDSNEAGHEGSTQLVDIHDLEGAPDQDRAPSIEEDQVLEAAYQFGPADIDRGDVTLLEATNQNGRRVLLRQVWSGDADAMPPTLRERINALDKLDAPGLVAPEGMMISESGAWLELPPPPGRRMSQLIAREGPQDVERVVGWIRSIAETLRAIHQSGLVYAHLTPDSVWIDDDDRPVLEPFDVGALVQRGDLGQFGPPEMQVHDDETKHLNLTPAADVYSLAAVMLGGITGIPLEPRRVAALESEEIKAAVRQAVVDSPRERIQSVDAFVDQLGNIGGPSLLEGLDFEFAPGELDFKVLLAITLGLMAVTTGVLILIKGVPGSKPPPAQDRDGSKATAAESTSDDSKKPEASTEQAPSETTKPPGPIETDPRLTLESSYQTNPPVDASRHVDGAAGELENLRNEARKKVEAATGASDVAKKEKLTAALEAVARSIRLQDGSPKAEDRRLLDKLRQREPIRAYHESLLEKLDKHLENGSVSQARRSYQKLRAIDPSAASTKFFTTLNSANVEDVEPVPPKGGGSSNEDGDEK